MICVSIGRTRHKMIMAEIQAAGQQGAELIELRLDFLARPPDFKRLLANRPCPLVVTLRRPPDGGRWAHGEDARQMIIRQAIVAGFDWVDLEEDIAEQIPRFRDVKRIISYHNLREMPENLEEIHARMCAMDADVVKLAVRGETPSDNVRVLKLVQKGPKPTVAICMGDMGVPSRILGAKFGAPFTYAAFNIERGIAPGILSFDEMKKVYRYDSIARDAKIYAVIGDPIGHSLSPLAHNAAFRALGFNGIYVPIRIPRGQAPGCIKDFDALPIDGYSVTIPHKEAVIAAADERDAFVDWTQAANTLVRRDDGTFMAHNTDCPAAVEVLQTALANSEMGGTIAGRTILLLGAGGAARAIAHGLHRQGALLIIANRTGERGQRLAEEVGCRACDWTARHSILCDTLINTTSVGMYPHMDDSPIHVSFLRPGLLVFDVIYNPETTLLVKEARERGCQVLTGVDMFVRQAALQCRLFTDKDPPIDAIRKVVKRALSPVAIKDEESA